MPLNIAAPCLRLSSSHICATCSSPHITSLGAAHIKRWQDTFFFFLSVLPLDDSVAPHKPDQRIHWSPGFSIKGNLWQDFSILACMDVGTDTHTHTHAHTVHSLGFKRALWTVTNRLAGVQERSLLSFAKSTHLIHQLLLGIPRNTETLNDGYLNF